MLTASMHGILGEGADADWTRMVEHPDSFLVADVDSAGAVKSLHELIWQGRKPRVTPGGALGWVIRRQSCTRGGGEPLPRQGTFRVHICRQRPCPSRAWHPKKYGNLPAPLLHGRMVELCDAKAEVDIEKSWKRLTGCEEAQAPSSPVGEAAESAAPIHADASLASMAVPCAAATERMTGCEEAQAPSSPVGEAADSAAPPTAVHAGAPSSPVGEAAEATPIVAAIRARADEISVPSTWIGMLEVMAFCAVHKRRVVLQLAEGTIDIMSSLAPMLMDCTWKLAAFDGRLVACKLVGAVWCPASLATCSHFVAAKPLREPLLIRGGGVIPVMARLGFATIMTSANGDCGIESLLVLCNGRRGPVERNALRRQLQAFMHSVSMVPAWHDAFVVAGEVLPESSAVAEK